MTEKYCPQCKKVNLKSKMIEKGFKNHNRRYECERKCCGYTIVKEFNL
jgi:hypothetical protein